MIVYISQVIIEGNRIGMDCIEKGYICLFQSEFRAKLLSWWLVFVIMV